MSHLSLDARTVLEYLNELGYRNITSEQLKEFLRGMQRHSEYKKNNNNNKQQTSTAARSGRGSSNSTNIPRSQEQSKESIAATATSESLAKGTSANPSNNKSEQQQKPFSKHKGPGPSNGVTPVKIVKSRKPLCHFRFYLDICDNQTAKKIEELVTRLGGTLEFFLTSNVTHFITDKTVLPPTVGDNNNTLSSRPGTPQTPATPSTPQTPYSIESQAHTSATASNDSKTNALAGISRTTRQATSARLSRADAILSRARRQSSTATAASPLHVPKTASGATTVTQISANSIVAAVCSSAAGSKGQSLYTIWQTEQALRFFKKVQTDLKEYIDGSRERKPHSSRSHAFGPTYLKGGFIKIESLKRNYRPYYQLFKKPAEWPKIDLSREDGAFRLSPKKQAEHENPEKQLKMTRKSRSQSSQRPVQHQTVQALKKGDVNHKSSVGVGQRNSNACKQAKESSDKQCGVCEICKIEYDTLAVHLKTKDHEFFAKNSQNFIALDTLIRTSANVKSFLGDDRKGLLEEMEVEEDLFVDTDAKDPLGGDMQGDSKRLSSDSHQTPSPTLRERSKRSTKGKHSSEKFLNTPNQKAGLKGSSVAAFTRSSPSKSASVSPQRKPPLPPPSAILLSSSVPAHPSIIEVITTNTVTRTTSTKAETTAADDARRKPTSVVLSPPIRPKLPLSSMYKVVETPEILRTPPRKTRGDAFVGGDAADMQQTVASPSLIVKFKKVRQNELCRLSGEAESFMFPKQHSSSELPTDIDRHTTSDNAFCTNLSASMSSTSLDSTSESHTMDIESEKTERSSQAHTSNSSKNAASSSAAAAFANRKAIAKAKRRKNSNSTASKVAVAETENQNFPAAPIQPEIQLKSLRSGKMASTPALPSAKSSTRTAASSSVALPEATRKSSRTATAIVTAATTSSRLLRAAVEAARKASDPVPVAVKATTKSLVTPTKNAIANSQVKTATVILKRSNSLTVVKLEDGMGDDEDDDDADNPNHERITRSSKRRDTHTTIFPKRSIIETLDDDSDEHIEDDDCIDSDYDEQNLSMGLHKSESPDKKDTAQGTPSALLSTREERALRRQNQKVLDELAEDTTENFETEASPTKSIPRKSNGSSKKKPKGKLEQRKRSLDSNFGKEKKTRGFDFTKSEKITNSRYAFERVPVGDPWYKAYVRQDTTEEKYFEYYGSTNYRKLPYELGPIPFNRTICSSCKLCQGSISSPSRKTESSDKKETEITSNRPDSSHSKMLNVNGFKIKEEERLEISKIQESKALNCDENKKASNIDAASSYQLQPHKHKKIHLLQRYHEEQQELLQRQQHQKTETLSSQTHMSRRCDSKASTPERGERDRERAGSTHSNTSSCASSSTTATSKMKYRNRHLSRAAFLNLEIPPRKSPREHASTLALVSCMIRQRQDSLSKPNSECDDASAPSTPTPMLKEEDKERDNEKSEMKPMEVGDFTAENFNSVGRETRATPHLVSLEEKTIKAMRSPKATRSAASTPIEELRFTSEISENVKRMRRGQNKYDHSPPLVLKSPRSVRGGRSLTLLQSSSPERPVRTTGSPKSSSIIRRRRCTNIGIVKQEIAVDSRQRTTLPATSRSKRRRPKTLTPLPITAPLSRSLNRVGGNTPAYGVGHHSNSKTAAVPSIRKIGSKKGVLEFEVDASALDALDKALQYEDNRRLEWQIDKYLQLVGKDYDVDLNDIMPAVSMADAANEEISTLAENAEGRSSSSHKPSRHEERSSSVPVVNSMLETNRSTSHFDINTPPPTDCAFSSDFDLYDLFTGRTSGLVPSMDDDPNSANKSSIFSIFNSQAVQSYFRSKRKSLKSNRTGWPKVQKKKVSMRQQKLMRQKIRFLNNVNDGLEPATIQGEEHIIKIELEQNHENNSCDSRVARDEGDVMTPPYTDDNDEKMLEADELEDDPAKPMSRANSVDVNENGGGADDEEEYFEEANDTEMGDESIPDEEDAETLPDSVEYDEQTRCDGEDANGVDIEGADADAEIDDDDDDEAMVTADEAEDDDREDESSYEEKFKNLRRASQAASPQRLAKLSHDTLQPDRAGRKSSTPTTNTPFLRCLRRTPTVLLNGSLGSCVSPSERAGDNSDIFTVSSDGLDTDLDMSNSHTHFKNNSACHGADEEQDANKTCPHRTPTRKRLDISKYTPANRPSKTCAAEAATAAVKSLAISQYLKKEVRVTCRRLKPPFRKFRYRR